MTGLALTEGQHEMVERLRPVALHKAKPFIAKFPYLADDICSVASVMLCVACRSYRPGRGASDASWVALRVEGAIVDFLYDDGAMDSPKFGRAKRCSLRKFVRVDPVAAPDPRIAAIDNADTAQWLLSRVSHPGYRRAVEAVYLEGQTILGFGHEYGVSECTAHKFLKRGLLRMREAARSLSESQGNP